LKDRVYEHSQVLPGFGMTNLCAGLRPTAGRPGVAENCP
jgi:hypothetical protein